MGFQLKLGDNASQDILTVIYINDQSKSFDFAMMTNKNKETFLVKSTPYLSNLFGADFFEEFFDAVQSFAKNNPNAQNGGVAILLPDKAVAQDSINLPIMKRNVMDNNFRVSYENLYKNHQDLKMNFVTLTQGKQYAKYVLSMVKKDILTAIESVCTANKLSLKYFTTASASTLNAVYALKQKYKNECFLILDVKQNYSRFVFNTKDRASGYYILPFGYDALYQDQMPQEDMLFDHYFAELTVVNAKEKAKSKALTMAIENEFVAKVDMSEQVDESESDIDEQLTEDKSGYLHLNGQSVKVLPKKVPRKLPKFMQRDLPTTTQGFVYENFRLLLKWALTLLENNPNVTQQGAPEFVLVNLPSRFNFVFELAQKEQKETLNGNAIKFVELEQNDKEELINANLELFGGFVPLKSNAINVF